MPRSSVAVPSSRSSSAFCAQKRITADYEIIKPPQINEAYERLERGDVRYRFVLDLK